jgi:uncharacterized protein YjbI with pentapeptide repeats|tara:strand:+ start:267 stop:386 length:120 start_codon:yes stop_codon:yes gene_type:complete
MPEDFADKDLTGANLSGAILFNSNLTHVIGTDFTGAILE